jgi:hypothetical protein
LPAEGGAGQIAAAFAALLDVADPKATVASTWLASNDLIAALSTTVSDLEDYGDLHWAAGTITMTGETIVVEDS